MLTDHIAILTHSALAEPVLNKKKKVPVMEFYGLFAFPPAAGADLADLAKQVAPGGNLAGLSMNVKPNSQQTKPIPGIPGDWFIVRAASQFAPYIADEHGKQLEQAEHASAIRSKFYAGKKVRVSLTAFAWNYDGKPGVSYNLAGVMEAGEGDRLNIGSGVAANTFEKYAQPESRETLNMSTPGAGQQTAANPFAQHTPDAGQQTAANPFAPA